MGCIAKKIPTPALPARLSTCSKSWANAATHPHFRPLNWICLPWNCWANVNSYSKMADLPAIRKMNSTASRPLRTDPLVRSRMNPGRTIMRTTIRTITSHLLRRHRPHWPVVIQTLCWWPTWTHFCCKSRPTRLTLMVGSALFLIDFEINSIDEFKTRL